MYVVCILENESDFPGIVDTYGPFDYDEIDIAVSILESRTGFVRGEQIQVSYVQPLPVYS